MPSASDFDPDLYRLQVLEPARKLGGVLPGDLLLRYAVPDQAAADAELFEAHVARMVKHWRALKQKRVYQSIAAGLLAAHADLAASGRLTYSYFARCRDEDQASARRSLDRLAADLAATTSVVPRSTVSSLHTVLRGSLSERAVEEALLDHQVTVIERGWTLPDAPPGAARSILTSNLAILGLSLAAEAVFGTEQVRAGFRLRSGFQLASGARLTREQLNDLKLGHAKRALDERKTALDNVLATLAGAVDRPRELDAMVVWQLIDVLQPQIAAGLPVRAIAGAAADLGLDRTEAAELALSLMNHPIGLDPVRAAVQGALDAGELFTARRRAVTLPEDDVLRQRIELEVSRVESLIKDADEAHRRGTAETEAELLSQAVAIAADAPGDLGSRLQSLPPPPPAQIEATIRDDRVQLSWPPAPTRTSGIRYLVLRGIGSPVKAPGAGSVVALTSELQAIDADPPYGEALYYSVFAARGADVWSAGTEPAEPVVVLAEVRRPELDARNGAILGSWQLPAGASDVLVSCQPGSAPASAEQGRRIPATPAGFHDLPADAGVRYYYRICAVYVGRDGQRRISPGVVEGAILEIPMDAVDSLRAESLPGGDPRLRLAWTAPARGSVMIYRHHLPLPWQPGTSIRLDELSRHGRPIAGAVELTADRENRITTHPQDGRSYFTAMTVGIRRALVGSTVSVAFVSPIEQLQARRYENRVRLRWNWPDGTQICRVQWWPGTDSSPGTDSPLAAQLADCGRRRYHDDGGFEITVDSRPTTVRVRAVRHDAAGEIASPPLEVTVPGQDVAVRYAFRSAPWRRTRLVLTADRACRVPPLVVVRGPGRVMPLRAESGLVILRTPALDLRPGKPLSVPVPVPAGADQTWLGCFVADNSSAGIALIRADGGV
jgi:hypothetical protein